MKRRKPTTLGIIGTTIGVLGVIGLTWGSIDSFKPDRVGIALLVVGAIIVCYKRLETKNLAADEIFNVGRERGEADGYKLGYHDGLEDGHKTQPARPVIVPLHHRCEDCQNSAAPVSVGGVADRG